MPPTRLDVKELLLEWVKEWETTARERNSKGVTVYKKAYNSLNACPLNFTHPAELKQLHGYGDKLCQRLTERLSEHCQENGIPMPKKPRGKRAAPVDEDEAAVSPAAKKPRRTKPYVPTYRSGAYALVVALNEVNESNGIVKDRLIALAQPHCDSSFTAPSDPTKFHTAWSSMKTLLEKDLVYEKRSGATRRYILTDEGAEVARRIQQTRTSGSSASGFASRSANPGVDTAAGRLSTSMQTQSTGHSERTRVEDSAQPDVLEIEPDSPKRSQYADVVANGTESRSGSELPRFRPGRLAPGSFTVELVLDVREVRAKHDRDYMQDELAKRGVKPIMRSLELGDAVWVAKCHDGTILRRIGSEGDEVVLDWIVERKRLDDLVYSIKDGRFHEQKFRLKRSGVKNVIYIIEEMAIDPSNRQRYDEAIRSAIASTQVVNGYFLKQTQNMDDTIRYLTRMTMLLKKQYEDKPLLIIPTEHITAKNYLPLLKSLREKEPLLGHYVSFPAFESLASKSEMMTLRDLYLKMLMCTKQVTGEKALEIQRRWKTPYEFVQAFEACGSGGEGKQRKQGLVFAQMGNLFGRKKVTKVLSEKIAEVWGDVLGSSDSNLAPHAAH